MEIQNLFRKDIHRNIEGVIKIGKDDNNVRIDELSEYVVTNELKKHFDSFFKSYADSLHKRTADIGVWISGFFGSGKSHFLKILSYILSNKEVNGQKAYKYFEDKELDNLLMGKIKTASDYSSDVILFNIDSKSDADAKTNKEALVKVFNKVFNSMQGFSESIPWLAELELSMVKNGTYDKFKAEYNKTSGFDWTEKRDDFYFEEENIVQALSVSNNISKEAAQNLFARAENSYSLSIDTFAIKVREYIERKGKNHNVIFMIDEMGQYIGESNNLTLNLQTIVENLGTECGGKAWVVVTSQEAINSLQKNINSDSFSKIAGRFKTRLSLSSSNVDEVIQKRILDKNEDAIAMLKDLYNRKNAVLKNLITFSSNTPSVKLYKDAEDFVINYPFVPYQFNLLQAVFNNIRTKGASGKHLSEGERSLLSAFKEAASKYGKNQVNLLVPFSEFYNSIDSFLESDIKRIIVHAEQNDELKNDKFNFEVLKLLFMLKDLEDKMPANLENLTTLMTSSIDEDKIVLKRKIEVALKNLSRQNLIQRDGENFIFLTNDEQDLNKEVEKQTLDFSDYVSLIGGIVFDKYCDIKYHYGQNYYFPYNQVIDDNARGQQGYELTLSVYSPYFDKFDEFEIKQKTFLNKNIIIKLGDSKEFQEDIDGYLKLKKFVQNRLGKTASTNITKLLNLKMDELSRKEERIMSLISQSLRQADIYCNATNLEIKEKDPKERINDAFKYLVENSYTKIGYITKFTSNTNELILMLKNNYKQMTIDNLVPNQQAIDEVKNYLERKAEMLRHVSMKGLKDDFSKIPYGYNDLDIVALIVTLFKSEDIGLELSGNPISAGDEQVINFLTKRDYIEKVQVKFKKKTSEELIENIKRIFKVAFARSISYSTNEKLKQDIIDQLDSELYHITTMLGKYRASGYYPTTNYTLTYLNSVGIGGVEYPGYEVVNSANNLFTALKKVYEPEAMFETLCEKEPEIKNYCDNIEVIKNFFKNQVEIFDKACFYMDLYERNNSYLNEQAYNIVFEIEQIVKNKNPYGEIYKLHDLCNSFSGILIIVLEKEAKPIKEQIKSDLNEVVDTLNNYGISDDHVSTSFNFLIDRLDKAQTIADIIAIASESSNFKVLCINDAAKKYKQIVAEKQKANPTEKIEVKNTRKWINVDMAALTKGINKIESKADIEKLTQQIKDKLTEMLGDDVVISLK